MCDSNAEQHCASGCNNACRTASDLPSGAIGPETTVRELVLLKPRAVSLLNELGVDTCCGAGKSISEVAAQSGLGVDNLVQQLSTVGATHSPSNRA